MEDAENAFGIGNKEYSVMCHHFQHIDELTEAERREVLAEHSVEELETEYTTEELSKLGIDA